jgi:hypothetical protein
VIGLPSTQWRIAVCCALGCWTASPGLAQRALVAAKPSAIQPTLRMDAIVDRNVGAQVAAGVSIVAAYNVRLAIDVGAGILTRSDRTRAAGRVDLLGRWLSDPFRRSRWALNGGGGLGLQAAAGSVPRIVAIITLGVDGPGYGAWVPGVEAGLGGGARLGLTFRRAVPGRR